MSTPVPSGRAVIVHLSGIGQANPPSAVAYFDGKVHLLVRDDVGEITRLVMRLPEARIVADQLAALLAQPVETAAARKLKARYDREFQDLMNS